MLQRLGERPALLAGEFELDGRDFLQVGVGHCVIDVGGYDTGEIFVRVEDDVGDVADFQLPEKGVEIALGVTIHF